MNFTKNCDFDFESDKSNRFVPLIIGFLIYSVTIAMMSGFFTHNLTSEWKDSLNGRITVEIQSGVDIPDSALTDKQNEEITKILKTAPGVKSVRKLRETDILKILEPWLSGTAIPDNFPFPTIFDVETDGDAKTDLLLMTDKLSKVSSGVRIHDHANWYAPIMRISDGLFGFAVILCILIFATVCATVIFITRKTLGVHLNTVKILQLIGANNAYIASQFKQYYLVVGCKSSLISFVCSLLTVVWINFVSSNTVCMSILKYIIMSIAIPIVVTLLIMVTSRETVLFFLKNDKRID
jgi:cell division transport system permease protein